VRRTITVLASAGAVASGIFLGAAPASAAPPTTTAVYCAAYQTHYTSGARATWRECYEGSSRVRVDGWVTDTDSDGQCGRVYARYNIYPGTDYSNKACPDGETEYFTFPWRDGSDARVYLQEVNA